MPSFARNPSLYRSGPALPHRTWAAPMGQVHDAATQVIYISDFDDDDIDDDDDDDDDEDSYVASPVRHHMRLRSASAPAQRQEVPGALRSLARVDGAVEEVLAALQGLGGALGGAALVVLGVAWGLLAWVAAGLWCGLGGMARVLKRVRRGMGERRERLGLWWVTVWYGDAAHAVWHLCRWLGEWAKTLLVIWLVGCYLAWFFEPFFNRRPTYSGRIVVQYVGDTNWHLERAAVSGQSSLVEGDGGISAVPVLAEETGSPPLTTKLALKLPKHVAPWV